MSALATKCNMLESIARPGAATASEATECCNTVILFTIETDFSLKTMLQLAQSDWPRNRALKRHLQKGLHTLHSKQLPPYILAQERRNEVIAALLAGQSIQHPISGALTAWTDKRTCCGVPE